MDEPCILLLDDLERLEHRLLAWGVVDAGFTRDEVLDRAASFAGEYTPEDLVEQLLARRLLFERSRAGQTLFRSRSAEAVRLAARLRQWLRNRPWRTAPTLVADFRFSAHPRRFPRRDRSPHDLISVIRERMEISDAAVARLLALIDDVDGLSQFQVDATRRIIQDLATDESRGTVVCAGTGTGKSLCFYLPVLGILGEASAGDAWTRILALYPRNELLKDQFTNALDWVHRLNRLPGRVGRRIRIGAFFGPTPRSSKSFGEDEFGEKWMPTPDGVSCPFARCPRCEGDLIWPDTNRSKEKEALRCVKPDCGFELRDDEIVLTRYRMRETPPDLLFTTTETLNRQISDARFARVFGVGSSRAPRAVLLDELHIYDGIHGAHVANLIRRWRHAIGDRHAVQFTALSATLLHARDFFASMTGLDPGSIEHIEPLEEHTIYSGRHYQLALRGDPVSATALLSTTIQASMLFARMLDPLMGGASLGAAGSKLFVFTDDLDVAHRLYANLLSAEGFPTRPWEQSGLPLASLRAGTADEPIPRDLAGQNWRACEGIGHRLTKPLQIDLTSSKKRGVDPKAEVVVTTATLEVGFDDDKVGAVIQHKAPRGPAAFIQRIGRAGRPPVMRPWSIIVLSDYGRDRLAYQRYETLFDPQLPPRTLPIHNRYVLRIQAAFAFMDWLTGQIKSQSPGSVWSDLSMPYGAAHESVVQRTKQRQEAMATVVESVLQNKGGKRKDLERHIRKALGIDEAIACSLMWDEPRSLLFSVLPTVHRRLVTQWKRMPVSKFETEQEEYFEHHPLPEFVPARLFGDLNLPEVSVRTPASAGNNFERMPVLQAMRAFAPGKVSRRFVVNEKAPSQWVPLQTLAGGRIAMRVGEFCVRAEALGPAQEIINGVNREVMLFRPWGIQLENVPANVQTQSNASLLWRAQISPVVGAERWPIPAGSGWGKILEHLEFYLNAKGTQILIRRFAVGAVATTRKSNEPNETLTRISFITDDGDPAAVGFEFEADAVVFRFRAPQNLAERWLPRRDYSGRSIRTAYFRARVLSDEQLDEDVNIFLRDRLQEIYLSALTEWAATRQAEGQACSLAQAAEQVHAAGLPRVVERVLQSIFQTLDVEDLPATGVLDTDGCDEDGGHTGVDAPRLLSRLRELFAIGDIQDILRRHAAMLWSDPKGEDVYHFEHWLRGRLHVTLGQALLQACRSLCPQTDAGDLILDVESGPRAAGGHAPPDGLEEIWLSEELPGGTGVVEQFMREYARDPRRFFALMDAALAPAEFEIVDEQLTRAVRAAANDDQLATLLHDAREAVGIAHATTATSTALAALEARGIRTLPAVRSSLFIRVLRPGTSRDTDRLLADLVSLRDRLEEGLGVEIDARVFAFVAGSDRDIQARLVDAAGGVVPADESWYAHQVSALLWPRGSQLRSQALSSYNPFTSLEQADRIILEGVGEVAGAVSIEDPNWRCRVREVLEAEGVARLAVRDNGRHLLRAALLELATVPLEIGFLSLHPRTARITIEGDIIYATLRLRETI